MGGETLARLEGTVDSVLFHNESNGYVVLDLDTGSALVTVVGELGSIDEGEELCLSGEYVNHPKFGSQFKAVYCERKLPATAHAIEKYLSSGAIRGIGPTLAKRIVEKFGERTLEVMENSPQELIEIKGISPKKLDEISQEFQRIFGIRKLMIYLSGFRIPPAAAVKVWKKWGQFSLDMVRDNPYLLCDNGIDLEFQTAENVASELGIPKDSHDRIRAGITYILQQNAFSGHTCLPADRLEQTACKFLGVTSEQFKNSLKTEYEEENVVEYVKGGRSFVYLYDYYIAEALISQRAALMKMCRNPEEEDLSTLIKWEEERKGISYGELQKKAIQTALSEGFLILTGGPGTGKTTTLNGIISLFEQKGMRVQLAAPTGRAAKRISDLTGYEAKTIHRLLEMSYDNDGHLKFVHNENNPIACDVLIVDEMSMVDVLLFEALLRALKLNCRFIMVGDSDQLPSVGAGNLLRDLIESKAVTVVRLEEIFRQAQKSSIVTNAHRIVRGEQPDLLEKDSDFFFFQRLDIESAAETVVDLYKNRLPKAYGMIPDEDIQILCPSRKGILGSVELNRRIQAVINPPDNFKKELRGILFTFREQDKVMQTKNNYDVLWKKDGENGAGIFNGDMGKILEISRAEGNVTIDFDGRITRYPFEQMDQLELAYAVTVHKSQGSEFNAVIIPLLGGFEKLCYRNLLYTAVTRAKKLLILVGSKNQVEAMVNNDRRTLRYTCLKDMIRKEIAHEPEENLALDF